MPAACDARLRRGQARVRAPHRDGKRVRARRTPPRWCSGSAATTATRTAGTTSATSSWSTSTDTIFEGRAGGIDQAVVGAQAQGYNSQSTGIANLGTFSTTGQTEAGSAALARLLSWKLALHGVAPQGKVAVRSGGGATNRYPAGAGGDVRRASRGTATANSHLLSRRRPVRAARPAARAWSRRTRGRPTVLGLSAVSGRIPYGRKARLSGALTPAGGAPLAGRGVRIQALGSAGSARTLANVATGAGGAFAINLRLAFNRTLLAGLPAATAPRRRRSLPLPDRRAPARDGLARRRDRRRHVEAGQRVRVTGQRAPAQAQRRCCSSTAREATEAFRRVAEEAGARHAWAGSGPTYRFKQAGPLPACGWASTRTRATSAPAPTPISRSPSRLAAR